jgi:hypothetical protein
VPDGIIAHLAKECGGNVPDRKVVTVTAGSFERITEKEQDDPKFIADLEGGLWFVSDCRRKEDIPLTPNS